MSNIILYIGEMELPDKNAAAHRVLANSKIIENSSQKDVVLIGLSNELISSDIIKTKKELLGFTVFEYKYPITLEEWYNYITKIQYIETVIFYLGLKNIEAIIAYNYPAIALERLRRYCKKNEIKIISDVSEWYGKSKRKFPSNLIKNFDTFYRMRLVNSRCNNLICASKYLESYYSKKNCNIINIPSLVDINNNYINSVPFVSTCKIFSFIGSPGKSKEKERLDWIVNFFHSVRKRTDFNLVLVGVTKESLLIVYPELTQKVEDLGRKITFKGRIHHVQAIDVILQSHFTVFARMSNRVTNAGFPTKLAESFSCGIPVVTTPSSNVNDYIIEGKSGYISEYCNSKSFNIALTKALNCSNNDISYMKNYINKNNPLKLELFYDNWKKFYNGEIK